MKSKPTQEPNLRAFIFGLGVAACCSAVLFLFGIGRLGDLIWPSYPGVAYLWYLVAWACLGILALGYVITRYKDAPHLNAGLYVGTASGLVIASGIMAFLVTHV